MPSLQSDFMIDPSGTEVVFEELRSCYVELLSNRRFPARFRRAFDQYLYKSQQITEVMRREYHKKTGKPWNASAFSGWNEYTSALKAIRNAVVHGTPLLLHEITLSAYPAVAFAHDTKTLDSRQLKAGVRLIKGTSFVDLPFQEEFITTGAGFLAKEGGYVFPLREFVSYELQWSLLEAGARSAVESTKTNDVVRIVLCSFPILHCYFYHYKAQLEQYKFPPTKWELHQKLN